MVVSKIQKGAIKIKMTRQQRRKLARETDPKQWGQRLLQNALQNFYEAMRDNRIGEERAERILKEAVEKMGE